MWPQVLALRLLWGFGLRAQPSGLEDFVRGRSLKLARLYSFFLGARGKGQGNQEKAEPLAPNTA